MSFMAAILCPEIWINSITNIGVVVVIIIIITGYTCMSFMAAILCPEIWINSITNIGVERMAQQ